MPTLTPGHQEGGRDQEAAQHTEPQPPSQGCWNCWGRSLPSPAEDPPGILFGDVGSAETENSWPVPVEEAGIPALDEAVSYYCPEKESFTVSCPGLGFWDSWSRPKRRHRLQKQALHLRELVGLGSATFNRNQRKKPRSWKRPLLLCSSRGPSLSVQKQEQRLSCCAGSPYGR